MPQKKIRFKFTKTGVFQYLSHLDIARMMLRALARADILVAYSQGFNPKPKVNFSNPTPLGVESFAEYADILLAEHLGAQDFQYKLNRQLQRAMQVTEAKTVPGKCKSLMADIALVAYRFKLSIPENMDRKADMQNWLGDKKELQNTIYRMAFLPLDQNLCLLKLYGYAKILKNQNNGIFKYNVFYDYMKDMAQEYSVKIESRAKEEMFVLREDKPKKPLEVI